MAGKAPFGPIQKGFFFYCQSLSRSSNFSRKNISPKFLLWNSTFFSWKKVWAPLGLVASATQLSRTFKRSFQSLGNDSWNGSFSSGNIQINIKKNSTTLREREDLWFCNKKMHSESSNNSGVPEAFMSSSVHKIAQNLALGSRLLPPPQL